MAIPLYELPIADAFREIDRRLRDINSVLGALHVDRYTGLGERTVTSFHIDNLQSTNYVPMISGWRITRDGNVDINDLTSRGSITVPNGGVAIDNNGIYIDSDTLGILNTLRVADDNEITYIYQQANQFYILRACADAPGVTSYLALTGHSSPEFTIGLTSGASGGLLSFGINTGLVENNVPVTIYDDFVTRLENDEAGLEHVYITLYLRGQVITTDHVLTGVATFTDDPTTHPHAAFSVSTRDVLFCNAEADVWGFQRYYPGVITGTLNYVGVAMPNGELLIKSFTIPGARMDLNSIYPLRPIMPN